MTEIEMMLQDEIKKKKELARSAQRKPRRTRYRMDSDKLTEAQRQTLNGPVVSYNLNAPMVWADFKKLPEASQRLYLSSLIDRYAARDTMLAEMFGVRNATVSAHRGKLGVKDFGRGGNPEPECRLRWNEFLHRAPEAGDEPSATPEPVVTPEPEVTSEPVKEATPAASWDELFRMAKALGEQYGLHVRIEVTT